MWRREQVRLWAFAPEAVSCVLPAMRTGRGQEARRSLEAVGPVREAGWAHAMPISVDSAA